MRRGRARRVVGATSPRARPLAIAVAALSGYALTQSLSWPVQHMVGLMGELASGRVDLEVYITMNDEMGDLARAFTGIVASQRRVADTVRELAAGDFSATIEPRGDRDVVVHARRELAGTLAGVVGETNGVIAAAERGQLDALVRPVREASAVLQRAATRDLTARVTGTHAGELSELQGAVNGALDPLNDALAQVASAADQAAVAGQIAAGSQSLAEGTSAQAGYLDDISVRVREVGAVSARITDSAGAMRATAE